MCKQQIGTMLDGCMYKNRSRTTNETALTDLTEATLEVLGNVLPKRVTHSILQECNSRLKKCTFQGTQ